VSQQLAGTAAAGHRHRSISTQQQQEQSTGLAADSNLQDADAQQQGSQPQQSGASTIAQPADLTSTDWIRTLLAAQQRCHSLHYN
jgi:hypothetical protein